MAHSNPIGYYFAVTAFCLILAIPLVVAQSRIIIAHRGASGYLPEHTAEAVSVAHAMGADYLEQDVVLSSDGVPIVLHDIYIDTVTDVSKRFPDRRRPDGRYYAIDLKLDEIKQLRVTERFDHKTSQPRYPRRFPGGQGSFRLQTLEEELQLIQGLNKSTGRNAGIYPEIKAPAWHRKQGQDISKIVLEVLSRFGYKTKADKIYLQCFDFEEVKRIRNELGYQGKLIQLLTDNAAGESATDYDFLRTRQGLEEVAKVADGIGPALQQVVTGKGKERLQVTDLVKNAHAAKLEVHPYTFRADDLPAYAGSLEELLGIFFLEGGVDGVFTDHTDRAVAFLRAVNSSNRKK